MPKYYCDYCDTYLTHDSPSVRKTHCGGRKHKENVCVYYQKWLEDQVQKLVDDTTAAFKAGKIQNNPFSQATTGGAGGAAIPPPSNLAGAVPPVQRPPIPGAKPPAGLLGPPGMMPGAPMAPPMGGPPVGPMMGMPAPMGMMPPGMRPMGPPMAGPPMGGPMLPVRPMGNAPPVRMPPQ